MMVTTTLLGKDNLDEFIALIRVFEAVFEMENFTIPDDNHLCSVLSRPEFMAMVALDGSTVIGGLTGYVLHQYYAAKPLAYIYDLAVATHRQRQGIGTELIRSFAEHCGKRGIDEIFVQAEAVDEHAVDFYRKSGIFRENAVFHFTSAL